MAKVSITVVFYAGFGMTRPESDIRDGLTIDIDDFMIIR